MSDFMKPTMEQGTYSWLPQALAPINEYITQLQGWNMPDTGGVQQGIQNLSSGAERIQPIIEQMLMGQISGQDFASIDKLLKQQSDKAFQQYLGDVMARTGRGTARMRTLTGGAGEYATNLGLQQSGLRLEDLTRRREAGAQLAGLPSQFWGPVTSAELALLGQRAGWDIARMGNLGSMYGQIPGIYEAGNYGFMMPSKWDQYIAPWLNPLMQGAGAAVPFALF